MPTKTESLRAALEILGSGRPNLADRLHEALLDAAADDLLAQLDDSHPDYPEKCAELMAEVEAAVEAREELSPPVEGWEYWFGCGSAFRAYAAALEIYAAE